jgi:sec-independent protein translocase protein TatA
MFFLSPGILIFGSFLGGGEVVLILALIFILLGAKRLPEIAKGLGEGIRHLRKEIDNQAHDAGESLGGIYGRPAAQALTPENQTAELYDPAVFHDERTRSGRGSRYFRKLVRFWRLVCRSVLDRIRFKK